MTAPLETVVVVDPRLSLPQRALNKLRETRTQIVHRFRGTFGLYANEARDRLIDGAVRDNVALADAIGKQARVIADLHDRLAWYEKRIPDIRKARSAYDSEQRRQKKKAKREAERLKREQEG